MSTSRLLFTLCSVLWFLTPTASLAQSAPTLLGGTCSAGPSAPVSEPLTERTYVLDFPCDYRAGEDVTVILNLHGAGSNERYQRAYFPAFEVKEKYRLVIATPHSPARRWREEDDEYLQHITDALIAAVGPEHVKAFWLVGHSQGGATSRRLICTPFFADKVDGFVSLSGGRLGGAPARDPGAGRPVQAGATPPAAPTSPAVSASAPAADPDCAFSHIYATGQHEIVTLPPTSTWAQKLQCSERVSREVVVDTEAGRTHDSGNQNPGTRQWGLLPRPGSAQVFEYQGCGDGRVVADIVRLDKGHTEGLEPRIMEHIVTLMMKAAGGKIAH